MLIPVGDQLLTPRQVRSTYQWRLAARRACPPGSMCYRCGRLIQHGLRHGHPMGPSADHIVALADGGAPYDPANLRPCCFGCNSAKGARPERETFSDW